MKYLIPFLILFIVSSCGEAKNEQIERVSNSNHITIKEVKRFIEPLKGHSIGLTSMQNGDRFMMFKFLNDSSWQDLSDTTVYKYELVVDSLHTTILFYTPNSAIIDVPSIFGFQILRAEDGKLYGPEVSISPIPDSDYIKLDTLMMYKME